MFQRFLIPLDGSPLAERALPYAEALARAGGVSVVLVRAAEARASQVGTVPIAEPSQEELQAGHEATAYLHRIAADFNARGIGTEIVAPFGPAADEIVEQMSLRHPDAVIMTTHGRSGLGRWVYGSVAEAVLAKSPVPVLLIQSWTTDRPWHQAGGQHRLLVPLDGSDFSEAALLVATEFLRQFGDSLVLVRAVPPLQDVFSSGIDMPVVVNRGDDPDAMAEASRYLDAVVERLGRDLQGVTVRSDVRTGVAEEIIAKAAREDQITLVVMSTHGRTGLGRVVFGSVASSVLRQGDVPLLLVRPVGLRDTEQSPPVTRV